MAPEPDRLVRAQAAEWGAALALLPIAATLGYYVLPVSLQEQTLAQFAPQIFAYLAAWLWAAQNQTIAPRLGLHIAGLRAGTCWGLLTGLLLGGLNTFIILAAYPSLGYDITFLKQTPHGQLPVIVMVPWFICVIAFLVELNFRGFLLGRLVSLESPLWKSKLAHRLSPLALMGSALTFAFDPFMVHTFQHLHWIALWDGLIWGAIWLRTQNLYITIIAHAVEVSVMYSAVRVVIG
ncbi:MAG: CPBP family intramembrane metalloprotease [Nitrospirae bacterium]|nr:CPBP family intramembrane metalloprotease [Nitrospirota bacterium]